MSNNHVVGLLRRAGFAGALGALLWGAMSCEEISGIHDFTAQPSHACADGGSCASDGAVAESGAQDDGATGGSAGAADAATQDDGAGGAAGSADDSGAAGSGP